ncbi:MAG: hypothetical protein SFZ02_16475, partial [bacterium]|nr:hypothetical protein [bacterium]
IDKTGFNPLWASVMNDLTTGNNRLTDEAVNLGMSVRTGALEEFNRYSDLPSWGAPAIEVNGYYYQQIDFAHPLRANLTRILATENEAWGNPDMTGFVSAYYDTNYVVRLNMLKALQLQLNWVNFSLNTYEVNPPLMDYVRLTLGKTATDSPDAWVLLREWRDMEYFLAGLQEAESYADLRLFRNWERWLYQRDIAPNGMTIGVDNTISPLLIGIENDAYDYTASESRRTDHANGSDYIYFAIDDNFLKDSDQSVQILVTYLDNFVGTWWVEYDAGVDRVFHATPAQVMVNDMQWKTVTFAISDGSFGNRQTGDMDFRLYNGGEHDLTVQFVRIIKE